MNAKNAKDYLPLVQALADGKTIQTQLNNDWHDVVNTYLEASPCYYRIKPEPRKY